MIWDNSNERATEDEATAKPVQQDSRSRRIIRRLWSRAHWLLPNRVPPPHGRESAYLEERDRKSNGASRVPEDEELRIQAIWGLELFGPAEVGALFDSLARLKWTASSTLTDSAENWVRHQRAYGGAGAWYNVGMVTERGSRKRFSMVENFASLPEMVEYLLVRIFQLTPSLTCVLVGFVLNEGTARVYEAELNRDRNTTRKRAKHGWVSILGPEHLKRESIEQARSTVRNMVRKWFESNLHGFFCGLSVPHIPTAEFVTTRVHRPLAGEDEKPSGITPSWRQLLANVSNFDVWTCLECSGLQFWMQNCGWTEERFHLVVALRASDLPEDTLEYMGGRGAGAYFAYCHERLDGIFINYAAVAFLREVSKDLKTSRAALKIGTLSRRGGVRVLERIQSFFDRSLGTPAVAAELQDRSKRLALYQHECARFLAPSWNKDEEPREIARTLCEQTNFVATHVIAEEHSTREHFEQLSTILSVRESVKAQHRMEWLTVVALVVGASSLFVALPPVAEWPRPVREYVDWFRIAGKLGGK